MPTRDDRVPLRLAKKPVNPAKYIFGNIRVMTGEGIAFLQADDFMIRPGRNVNHVSEPPYNLHKKIQYFEREGLWPVCDNRRSFSVWRNDNLLIPRL